MALTRLILVTLSIFFCSITVAEDPGAMENSKPDPIAHRVTVNAARAQVFETWTTTEGVTTFFAPSADVELQPGGSYEIYFDPTAEYGLRGAEGCHVLSWIDNEMLSFSWNAPPKFGELRSQQTFVVIRFRDTNADKTTIELIHAGFGAGEEWQEVREYFDNAWPRVLANLAKRFETGPLWTDRERMTALRPSLQPWVLYVQPSRDDFYATGPTTDEINAIQLHSEYVLDLMNRNLLMLAGPTLEPMLQPASNETALDMPRVGVAIVYAQDNNDAQAILENDPAVKAGIMTAAIAPLRTVHQAGWVLSPDRNVQ